MRGPASRWLPSWPTQTRSVETRVKTRVEHRVFATAKGPANVIRLEPFAARAAAKAVARFRHQPVMERDPVKQVLRSHAHPLSAVGTPARTAAPRMPTAPVVTPAKTEAAARRAPGKTAPATCSVPRISVSKGSAATALATGHVAPVPSPAPVDSVAIFRPARSIRALLPG